MPAATAVSIGSTVTFGPNSYDCLPFAPRAMHVIGRYRAHRLWALLAGAYSDSHAMVAIAAPSTAVNQTNPTALTVQTTVACECTPRMRRYLLMDLLPEIFVLLNLAANASTAQSANTRSFALKCRFAG
jgi:hypothetical protein